MASNTLLSVVGMFAVLSMPVCATVQIQTIIPAPAPPQVPWTAINWTVTATDPDPGRLTSS